MRTRHVVAVAATAAIAAGAGTAIAQGTGGPPSGTLDFQVRVTDKARQHGINPAVPRNKKRPKVADLMAENAAILQDGKVVGRGHNFSVTTFEGARKYKGGAATIDQTAVDFGNGDILFASCLVEDSPTDNPCAVTGGTGRFSGARGTAVEETTKGKETKHTFTFNVHVTFMP